MRRSDEEYFYIERWPDRALCGACGQWTREFRKDDSRRNFADDESPWLCDPPCPDQDRPACDICQIKHAATSRPSLSVPAASLLICAGCAVSYDAIVQSEGVA